LSLHRPQSQPGPIPITLVSPPDTKGQFSMANSPNLHIFELWEETGAPGGNPRRHGEKVQTPHSDRSQESNLGPWCCANHCATVLPISQSLIPHTLPIVNHLVAHVQPSGRTCAAVRSYMRSCRFVHTQLSDCTCTTIRSHTCSCQITHVQLSDHTYTNISHTCSCQIAHMQLASRTCACQMTHKCKIAHVPRCMCTHTALSQQTCSERIACVQQPVSHLCPPHCRCRFAPTDPTHYSRHAVRTRTSENGELQ